MSDPKRPNPLDSLVEISIELSPELSLALEAAAANTIVAESSQIWDVVTAIEATCEASSEVAQAMEGILQVDETLASACVSGAIATIEQVETMRAWMEDFEREKATIDAAVKGEIEKTPFTIEDKKGFDRVIDFSTHPNGLGLSRQGFYDLLEIPGEWSRRFLAWKESRGNPKGKPGAPVKDQTLAIMTAWNDVGAPPHPIKATDLRNIAKKVGLLNGIVSPKEERTVRERVRRAIARSQEQGAT